MKKICRHSHPRHVRIWNSQWAENVYPAANSQRNLRLLTCLLLASLIPINTQGYALVRGWNCSLIVRLRTKMNPRWPQECLFTFLLLDLDIPCLIKHQKEFSEAICFCILVCWFSIGFSVCPHYLEMPNSILPSQQTPNSFSVLLPKPIPANVILYSLLILLNLFWYFFCLLRNVLRSPFSER